MKTKTLNQIAPLAARPVAVYARVSSEEQTKGSYPSCESQVEELVAACKSRGWEIKQIIKDEGVSAGSLKRPGLTELRSLVESEQITAIVCTWYDRLTRSRDFYVLDSEFQKHGVQFVTLHDPTDTKTAAGRFMESMLVAAKTYEREQTSEKVRSKMRMRAEKGMWNGGPIPFGFKQVDNARTIAPDKETASILREMFRIYTETGSDFKVRDWLQTHQIPSRDGRVRWQVSTLRKLLTNRRYIAQIEINRENKDLAELPESESYRIAPAPYEPIVSVEVFELAQNIRAQKSAESPNRKGRPRSYSQTQCQRVYPLQGVIVCAHCGHSMAPWYVCHRAGEDKSGKKRKKDSFIHYYLCAKQQKNWKGSDHKNCASATRSEEWVWERLRNLVASQNLIDVALEVAYKKATGDLEPIFEAYSQTNETLRKVEGNIEKVLESATSGQAVGALWEMLNERAFRLKFERDQLLAEQRRLKEQLRPAETRVDVEALRLRLHAFDLIRKAAYPDELQRLLRLLVRRVKWSPEGAHTIQLYVLPQKNQKPADSKSGRAVVSYCDALRYGVGDSNP